MVIPNELNMLVARAGESGLLSLRDFKYTPYNSDFGPFTLQEVGQLTKILARSNREQTVHIPFDSKTQARCVTLLACYLMAVKKMSIR